MIAALDSELAQRVVARLGRCEFRLYVNSDILGVELCGALKNIVASQPGQPMPSDSATTARPG